MIGKLIFRALPILMLVWGMKSSADQWSKYFSSFKGAYGSMMAEMQMNSMSRMMSEMCRMGQSIPSERSFEAWMRKNMVKRGGGDPLNDPFGGVFYMVESQGTLYLGTNGPDTEPNTDDDIFVPIECEKSNKKKNSPFGL